MPKHPSPAGSPAAQSVTVLHLVQPVEGGVARVVTDLVRAQSAAGLRVVVGCPDGGVLAGDARAAGAEVLTWRAGRSPGPGLPAEVLAAARLVRRVRPDLLHAHSAKAGLAGRIAVRGSLPTVFQPHAWSFDAVGGTTAALALRWERAGARWADRVLCVSEAERRAGESEGIDARWTVIRNGVDLTHFRPGHPDPGRDRAEARAGLPLPAALQDGPLAVCVGRLCPQKGQDVLLRAWPEVAATVPGARLALVGDGPDAERLRRAAPPGVHFAGAAADIRPWLRAADLVVLPSRWEGMALAPLEAMACGRPVLVSDVSGARESLPSGHGRLCLVPPEDPTALAKALGRLLAEPRLLTELGEQAQQHARSEFDVRRTTDAVTGLYHELLGRPAPLLHRGDPQPLNQERISR
ncbi:glycosyltransferase involved in cell wall biosynthesis [Streptomyces sp. 3211.6]|uniref:glycosyltransferase n=1 Tax=Streptomyces TaxID=1883 RepID=UPI0009A4959D|nr:MULTISPECIES: glycosyltransferase [Streptomyces]RKT05181.1 glycosyltransferase involved in cell wall biosynthesis [Streptomyces sp. 3211.6]RPF41083.1 glycosyltransferase involved in cell wall biosynthesis [Streptomyces sp. Ag109_G2-6]